MLRRAWARVAGAIDDPVARPETVRGRGNCSAAPAAMPRAIFVELLGDILAEDGTHPAARLH